MQRYELQCYNCGKTIGYISGPWGGDKGNNVISGTYDGPNNEHIPVCCPTCEERRLTVYGDV